MTQRDRHVDMSHVDMSHGAARYTRKPTHKEKRCTLRHACVRVCVREREREREKEHTRKRGKKED